MFFNRFECFSLNALLLSSAFHFSSSNSMDLLMCFLWLSLKKMLFILKASCCLVSVWYDVFLPFVRPWLSVQCSICLFSWLSFCMSMFLCLGCFLSWCFIIYFFAWFILFLTGINLFNFYLISKLTCTKWS